MSVRAEVVSLILDFDMDRVDLEGMDLDGWPGEHLAHLDGSPFTDAEADLIRSATVEEIGAASDAVGLANQIDAAEADGLGRLSSLLDRRDSLSYAEHVEVIRLADQWGVDLTDGERGVR